MLAYVMIGTNNLKRSAEFYDAALAPLGLARTGDNDRYFGHGPKSAPEKSKFYVTKPYDKKPATFGNGTMISLAAKSRQAVDEFHAAALASGGLMKATRIPSGWRKQLCGIRPRSRRQ